MGRARGGSAASAKESAKTPEKPSRATRGNRKSYVEATAESEDEFKTVEENLSDVEASVGEESGSEFGGDTSGSEYGKKKKKPKVAPKKPPAKRGRKPANKVQLSPKKRGRKPKAAASANGKRKRDPESSDEEEERAISSSDDEVSGSADTSGSEYGKKKASGKKLKKEKTPTRSQPRRQAAVSPKKKGRKPKAAVPVPAKANGNKKLKLDKDEEVEKSEEEMEIEEKKEKSDEEGTGDEIKDETSIATEKKKVDNLEEDGKSDEEEVEKVNKSEDEEESEEDEKVKDEKSVAAASKEKEKPKESVTLKNRVDTDFSSLDLTCDKKTPAGEDWNFKIACWNVAGIKAWVKKNGLEYLKVENPDILCLQETKCSEKTKPIEVKSIPEYPHTYWAYAEDAGQHGVATFTKTEPLSVSYGLPNGEDDSDEDKNLKEMFNKEGRLITTEFEKFYLLNAYVPNSGRPPKEGKAYPPRVTNGERQAWDRMFKDYVKSLEEKKPVIVTGDLNVAHEPIDLANPKTNGNSAGFTQEERDGFSEFLLNTKMVDSFRTLYPEKEKSYSFWTYMGNCRQKNVGWRLDYFLLSEKLKEGLCENLMRTEVYGSDHCPIVLFLHL